MPCWQSSGRHGLWTRRDSLHGLSTRRHRHYLTAPHMVSRRLRATDNGCAGSGHAGYSRCGVSQSHRAGRNMRRTKSGPRGDSFYAGYFRDPEGNKLNVFCMMQSSLGCVAAGRHRTRLPADSRFIQSALAAILHKRLNSAHEPCCQYDFVQRIADGPESHQREDRLRHNPPSDPEPAPVNHIGGLQRSISQAWRASEHCAFPALAG